MRQADSDDLVGRVDALVPEVLGDFHLLRRGIGGELLRAECYPHGHELADVDVTVDGDGWCGASIHGRPPFWPLAGSLALEALESAVPDAGRQGDARQVCKRDLEGVGRDLTENGVPQRCDLAGVLADRVAQVIHRRLGGLRDCDGLPGDCQSLLGRSLRAEGDGLVGFVVLFCGIGVGGDVGGHVGGCADRGDDVDGFLDDGGAAGGRDPLGQIAAVAVAVQHLTDLGIGILGIKAELAVVEALGLVAVGEDAAHGHGAVAVDLQLRDVDGRLRADHAGEGAGRLALLEVAIAEDDLGVVDLLAGHALRQNDQAGGGDVVVDKCSHVYLLSLV